MDDGDLRLGISIDGIPGLFNKYYDFEKSYKELTEYSQGIQEHISSDFP